MVYLVENGVAVGALPDVGEPPVALSFVGGDYRGETVGLLFALIGTPFVMTCTGVIYWTFRGKVELDEHSY